MRYLRPLVLLLFLLSCGDNGSATRQATSREMSAETLSDALPERIRLAEQYGLAYAPVAAARLQGWFEEELPDVKLEWSTLGNAAAIREAMLAGRLDGGCMGIPPYLIGRDRGMTWRAVSAVSEARLGLTAMDYRIGNLAGITGNMRIALPQPGSIQHILLSMAAERELGNSETFDDQLLTMSHPDGMNALLAGSGVDAHFTSPPFLRRELENGARLILDGNAAFGGRFTFIIAVLDESFSEDYPEAAGAIVRAINRGAEWISSNPRQAAELLSDHFHMDVAELESCFTSGEVVFTREIYGLEEFSDFMRDAGYLQNGAEG